MSQVTIGFVPRDRFCRAAESLERLFAHTQVPFELIVVDCNIPEVFRQQMAEVLKGRSNVTILRTDQYLLTNQCHNLVLRETTSEFLCLMENDLLVEADWLSHLLAACEEHPADVAVPLLIEQQQGFEDVHFDDRLGHIKRIQTPAGIQREIVSRSISTEQDWTSKRCSIGMIETHLVLYRSDVFRRIGPFDETMSTRAEVDVSLALDEAGVSCVFEPKARVTFTPPPPIYPEEREYYFFKWDVERAIRNHEHLEQKWGLVHLPGSVAFVKRRRALADALDPEVQLQQEHAYRSMLDQATSEIAALVPAGDTLILVDDVQWKAGEVARDRRVLPFLERDGQYWGPPPDGSTAIRELERLRQAGASFMVFAEPAFWWLDYYAGLHEYLRAHYPCVLNNQRIIAFDLRRKGA